MSKKKNVKKDIGSEAAKKIYTAAGDEGLEKKKIICPKCNREIFELEMIQTGTQYANVSVPGTVGPLEYSGVEFEGDGEILEYRCPLCHATIAESDADAARFFGLKE